MTGSMTVQWTENIAPFQDDLHTYAVDKEAYGKNPCTLEELREFFQAGVNILVSGTTIFKENGGNLKKNIQLLRTG